MDRDYMEETRRDHKAMLSRLERIEQRLEALSYRRRPFYKARRWLATKYRDRKNMIRNRCRAACMRLADRFSRHRTSWDVYYEHKFFSPHLGCTESRVRMPDFKPGPGLPLGTGLNWEGDDVSMRIVIAGVPMERFQEDEVVHHVRYYLLRADRGLVWETVDPDTPTVPDLKTTRFEWSAIRDFYIRAVRLGKVI